MEGAVVAVVEEVLKRFTHGLDETPPYVSYQLLLQSGETTIIDLKGNVAAQYQNLVDKVAEFDATMGYKRIPDRFIRKGK